MMSARTKQEKQFHIKEPFIFSAKSIMTKAVYIIQGI